MKITETIERNCCQPQDLVPYRAAYSRSHPLSETLHFCRHCGQWWVQPSLCGLYQRVTVTDYRIEVKP